LLTAENLHWCYHQLRKTAGVGVDNVSWYDYGLDLRRNLDDLVRRLRNNSYHARYVKRKYIPKLNGKMRPLGIPAIEDKIVQYAVSKILEAIFEQEFEPISYGYRPKVGVLTAVQDLTFELQFGTYGYIVEADIKGFFDNINHDWLIKMLSLKIRDKAFLALIQKWLKAGILDTDGKVIHPVTGTPQGGIVSPILANIYLHYALDIWFQKVVKQKCKGRAFIVRYADDFVVGFQFNEDAENFYSMISERLGKFGLQVEPSKTQKLRFSRFISDKGEQFDFLGFTFQWRKDKTGKPRVVRTTMKKKFKASCAAFAEWIKKNRSKPIADLMKTFKSKLQGYWNYYGLRGNFLMLNSYYKEVLYLTWKWLNRRSQRKSYTLKGIVQMLKQYKIPPPRITETPSLKRKAFLWI